MSESVRQRVATALLCMNQWTKSNHVQSDSIMIARKDIANLIGTVTQSLNRTLSDFKDEDLITITDSGITILIKTKIKTDGAIDPWLLSSYLRQNFGILSRKG